MAVNTWVFLSGFGWCLLQGRDGPEGPEHAAVVGGMASLGTHGPSRGHGVETVALTGTQQPGAARPWTLVC